LPLVLLLGTTEKSLAPAKRLAIKIQRKNFKL